MAVVIETTIGDFTVDLCTEERPRTCLNFLKLCKQKYYNLNLLYSVERNFVAQMGDPTGSGKGGNSIFQSMFGEQARLYEGEKLPVLKHGGLGTVSMVAYGDNMYGSQFFVTLGDNLDSLDKEHLVFGHVTEGLDVVAKLNDVLADEKHRPYQDIRISHTVVLDDPYPDPDELEFPDQSPRPTPEMLASDYIAVDESVDDTKGKNIEEIHEEIAAKEAEARATILEMVGDLPDIDMAPPENVLFVCKLNPVTSSEDLEIIFSRFGKIVCAEVIKDRISGNSLQYAFIEFDNKKSCEDAYFKMDNVLIDDRRIHVDFSQSVSKIKWQGRGRGVVLYDDCGKKLDKANKFKLKMEPISNTNDGEPKSRFIDTEAYGKRFKERNDAGRNYRNNGRRLGNSSDKKDSNSRDTGSRHNREDRDRNTDRNNRHEGGYDHHKEKNNSSRPDNRDDRQRRHSRDRDHGQFDQRDRVNDRRDRDDRRDDRRMRDGGERQHSNQDRKSARERADSRGQHNGKRRREGQEDRDKRQERVRDNSPERRPASPPGQDSSKRKTLLDHLRTELKSKRQQSDDDDSHSDADSSVDTDKKKKLAKAKKTKRKHSNNDGSSDSDSDTSVEIKKKRKAKKSKKKKKKRSHSSDSESDEPDRKKSKKKKKSKKSKH
uniref:Peptidyl-prolyl cis-trans isomerase n=2 Tax=Hirondellea gigas TaxID=1518452 RepID=A0A2P2I4E3_9CRUS